LVTRALTELALGEWNRALAVNLTGPFLLFRRCIPVMRARGWGRTGYSIRLISRSSQREVTEDV
jgi:NAD(P)-dependent dehydrogenase (short-subunit alcohol dehydrogenase family)